MEYWKKDCSKILEIISGAPEGKQRLQQWKDIFEKYSDPRTKTMPWDKLETALLYFADIGIKALEMELLGLKKPFVTFEDLFEILKIGVLNITVAK